MLDPWTYVYYNTSMQRNTQREPRSYLNQYSTDVIAQRGIDYLNDAHTSGKPFFIGLAPVGPHIQLTPPGHTEKEYPHFPIPAKRHEGLFKDVKIRDTKNFNPEQVRARQRAQLRLC